MVAQAGDAGARCLIADRSVRPGAGAQLRRDESQEHTDDNARTSSDGEHVQLDRAPKTLSLSDIVPEEECVTTVLAALDSNASGQPVLRTAIALAELYDSTVTCLHVREEASSAAAELARAAGVELREVSGSPIEEIVKAAQDPDIAALVLGARGCTGPPTRRTHRARSHHPHPKAGRRRSASGATA